MKSKKIILAVLLALVAVLPIFAERKKVYECGIYGQNFVIYEYTKGDKVRLQIFLIDNASEDVKTLDKSKNSITAIDIRSDWFTSASKYAEALQVSKDFVWNTTVTQSMVDIKYVLDHEPYCKLEDLDMSGTCEGKQLIYITYSCHDLVAFYHSFEKYK